MANKKIKPQTLKGFRDFLPADMRVRQKLIDVFRNGFEKYGYEPVETPALEYAEILLGKYGEEAEKLIYQFTDRGGRKLAMRYDLTVPAGRVLAQYADKLSLPFKRYQIQPVWRAENPQKGRFREFYQCDVDVFGTSSYLADAESIRMGIEILEELGFGGLGLVVQINSRKFLEAFLRECGVPSEKMIDSMIIIDKIEKFGEGGKARVGTELEEKLKLPKWVSDKIIRNLSFAETPFKELYDMYCKEFITLKPQLDTLKIIFDYLKNSGVSADSYRFKPSLSRGLSYYTGPIWEFVIADETIGSIAGGGRYDNLINLYLGKDVPATGMSFGIERIVEVIKERQMIKFSPTSIQVLVTYFDKNTFAQSLKAVDDLRKNNISTMFYPEQAKLDKQLKYADRKGIPYVVIIGPEEMEKKVVRLKDMKTGEQSDIKPEKLVEILRNS